MARFPRMQMSKIMHAALSYGLRAAQEQPVKVLLGEQSEAQSAG